MNSSLSNFGRYSRLALLLLMLAAQGISAAHDIGDSHSLKSDLCSTCIIGHGLGAGVSVSYETPALRTYQPLASIHSIAAPLSARTDCHLARAPPLFSRNT